MATASLPHHPQTLYHTDFDAFARALHAVVPELERTAAAYRTKFHAHGLPLTDRESMDYAVAHLLDLTRSSIEDEDDYYDRIAPTYHRSDEQDYNDEELLACGIDRS